MLITKTYEREISPDISSVADALLAELARDPDCRSVAVEMDRSIRLSAYRGATRQGIINEYSRLVSHSFRPSRTERRARARA